MLYMDANFFIFAILDTTEKGEKARKIGCEKKQPILDAVD